MSPLPAHGGAASSLTGVPCRMVMTQALAGATTVAAIALMIY